MLYSTLYMYNNNFVFLIIRWYQMWDTGPLNKNQRVAQYEPAVRPLCHFIHRLCCFSLSRHCFHEQTELDNSRRFVVEVRKTFLSQQLKECLLAGVCAKRTESRYADDGGPSDWTRHSRTNLTRANWFIRRLKLRSGSTFLSPQPASRFSCQSRLLAIRCQHNTTQRRTGLD